MLFRDIVHVEEKWNKFLIVINVKIILKYKFIANKKNELEFKFYVSVTNVFFTMLDSE